MEYRKVVGIVTADNEEPDCGRCDHICDRYEYCNEQCGAEHWWGGYERSVLEGEER